MSDLSREPHLDAAAAAQKLAAALQQKKSDRVVFAESCTAGMVAALLGQIAGISNWHCGSAVTYRQSAKQQWLDVSPATLENYSAESLETTQEMAIGVLQKTDEATISAAVTGHLGPNAPTDIDGKIFVALARRVGDSIDIVATKEIKLAQTKRAERQFEAATIVLDTTRDQITVQ